MKHATGSELKSDAVRPGDPNPPRRSGILKPILGLLVIDILVVLGLPALLSFLGTHFDERFAGLITFAVAPIYLLIALNNGAYSIEALERPILSVRRAMTSMITAQLSILTMLLFVLETVAGSRLSLAIWALTGAATLGFLRAIYGKVVKERRGGKFHNELLILDGGEVRDADLRKVAVLRADVVGLRPDVNNPQMLHAFGLIARGYDRIVVASAEEGRLNWAMFLKGANIEGEILLDGRNSFGAIGIGSFCKQETLVVSRKPLNLWSRANKRALDLAVTVPLLIMLLPLLVLIALAIKLDSKGPVLFRQARVGRGNCQFYVLKFRSMKHESSDARGARSAVRDDDRITRVGRFIRATSLDELPQLVNVLIGDMSLVGPRPHALGSLAGNQLFWEVDRTYWHRHQLKPGITGLAQIRGHRGATHRKEDLTDRLQSDMEYVEGWDIWTDINILLKTAGVLVHKNAF